MNDHLETLEEIQATLATLRQSPSGRKKFPKQVWTSIIQLTRTLPLQEVCRQLNIHPSYLKRKMQQMRSPTSDGFDFQELSYNIQSTLLTDNSSLS